MHIKSIGIGFVGLVLSVASVWAEPSSILGVVRDAKGEPITGASVRIEARNGERLIKTVKTDVNGHYASAGLPAGTYRITLVVNGAVKTSINNTTVELGEPTHLNFDLTPNSGWHPSVAAKKGRHWVGFPRLVEVVSLVGGSKWMTAEPGRPTPVPLNIVRISGEELQRTVHSVGIKRGQ